MKAKIVEVEGRKFRVGIVDSDSYERPGHDIKIQTIVINDSDDMSRNAISEWEDWATVGNFLYEEVAVSIFNMMDIEATIKEIQKQYDTD